MGGVLINGCGAADSYYVLKMLPNHPCISCGKSDYALMEVKMKIRVFFIPTVPIKTRYGVICPKCKNGYYVTEEQKNYILRADPSCVEVTSDGAIIRGIHSESVIDEAEYVPEDIAPEETASGQGDKYLPVPDEESPSQQRVCSCGAALMEYDIYCSKCGTRVAATGVKEPEEKEPEEKVPVVEVPEFGGVKLPKMTRDPDIGKVTEKKPLDAVSDMDRISSVYRRGKVCPECGMRSVANRTSCSICGSKLE